MIRQIETPAERRQRMVRETEVFLNGRLNGLRGRTGRKVASAPGRPQMLCKAAR